MSTNTSLRPLFSKQGLAATLLAADLLQYQPGDQIPRAQDYSRQYRLGAGTIQTALQQLRDVGVVRLTPRGHLGTFMGEVSYAGLWRFTMRGPLVGAMPLPYSHRYEGLATGLHEVFREASLPLNLIFIRGSLNRIDAMEHGRCDFVVMSRLAFEEMMKEGRPIAMVTSLGLGTWVGNHVVVLRERTASRVRSGMRVGIDTQSVDHTTLVRRACHGQEVEMVDIG